MEMDLYLKQWKCVALTDLKGLYDILLLVTNMFLLSWYLSTVQYTLPTYLSLTFFPLQFTFDKIKCNKFATITIDKLFLIHLPFSV